jgi:hypothetical protein
VDGPQQAHVAFLNEVKQGQAASDILLGDADDQPQVRQDVFLGRLEIALVDGAGQRQFLLGVL